MTRSESQKRATLKYNAKHYKRVPLDMTWPEYEELVQAAGNAGEPVNTYIKKAVKSRVKTKK